MIKVNVVGTSKVVMNIRRLSDTAYQTKNVVMKEVGEQFKSDVYNNITNNFSLAGHPYARRKPAVRHNPFWLVSRRSGLLSSLLDSSIEHLARISRVAVGWTTSAERKIRAPKSSHSYLKKVIEGSSIMISRPFLTGTFYSNYQRYLGIMRTGFLRLIYK